MRSALAFTRVATNRSASGASKARRWRLALWASTVTPNRHADLASLWEHHW